MLFSNLNHWNVLQWILNQGVLEQSDANCSEVWVPVDKNQWIAENGTLTVRVRHPLWLFPTWGAPTFELSRITGTGYLYGSGAIQVWIAWFCERLLHISRQTQINQSIPLQILMHYWRSVSPNDIDWRWIPIWISGNEKLLRSPVMSYEDKIPLYRNGTIQPAVCQWAMNWNRHVTQMIPHINNHNAQKVVEVPKDVLEDEVKKITKFSDWRFIQRDPVGNTPHSHVLTVFSPACRRHTLRLSWGCFAKNKMLTLADIHILPVERIENLIGQYQGLQGNGPGKSIPYVQLMFQQGPVIPVITWVGQGWEYVHTVGNYQNMVFQQKSISLDKLNGAWERLRTWVIITQLITKWVSEVEKVKPCTDMSWMGNAMSTAEKIINHPWWGSNGNPSCNELSTWFRIIPASYHEQFSWWRWIYDARPSDDDAKQSK